MRIIGYCLEQWARNADTPRCKAKSWIGVTSQKLEPCYDMFGNKTCKNWVGLKTRFARNSVASMAPFAC